MGRLTLNMLLSFAQFEREVTAEGAVSLTTTRLRLAREDRKWPTSGGERLPLG